MKKYEYMEINRENLEQLNALGAKGWVPAAVRWEEAQSQRTAWDPNCEDWESEGWTGLLYREGKK